jgi:hypothetical protein
MREKLAGMNGMAGRSAAGAAVIAGLAGLFGPSLAGHPAPAAVQLFAGALLAVCGVVFAVTLVAALAQARSSRS